MMLRIAIDGACRRNGKPDCVSSGGVFIQYFDNEGAWISSDKLSICEHQSTNQRGELLALELALDYIADNVCEAAQIITDSEYIFNAMTKVWYSTWARNHWKTSSGSDVKNADLWLRIANAKLQCDRLGRDIVFYHIKGHVIPYGKVSAAKLLSLYPNGTELYVSAYDKYETVAYTSRKDMIEEAQKLSEKNNGYRLPDNIFRTFVALNTVVDAIATVAVEEADREI